MHAKNSKTGIKFLIRRFKMKMSKVEKIMMAIALAELAVGIISLCL